MTMHPGRVRAVCELFGIRYPVILAGMTSVGTAPLAAAVSEAGGLGLLAAGRLSPEAFAAQIERARTLTTRPLGVNVPVIRDERLMQDILDVALKAKLSPIVLGGGNPAPWAKQVLAAGLTLVIVTATPQQARKAVALGAAAVVVAGYEAGGKTGADELGGLVAIPAVVDAVDVPVIASGGIVDGRSAAAAICLGAAAVQVGTRFMVTEESPLHPATKQAMIDADVTSTMIIARPHGMSRRMLVTPTARRIHAVERDTPTDEMIKMLSGAVSERGLLAGDLEAGTVACGQSVGRVGKSEPAGDLVRRIAEDMRAAIAASGTELSELT